MTDCPICEKHRGEGTLVGEVLYEDDLLVASHGPIVDGRDAYLGYVLVETRRHARGLAELTDDEASRLGVIVTRLARALEDATGADVIYSFVFDHTPHHHVHVVPRHRGTPKEYWGTRVDEWPDAPRGVPAEIREVSERIRRYLSGKNGAA